MSVDHPSLANSTSDTSASVEISLVVPLYNEEDSIAEMQSESMQALEEAGFDWELVLVDDGSKDGTLAGITPHPRVTVISFAQNAGQSAAMYAGIMAAKGEIIAMIDGDLQNDPADLPKLVKLIREGGADLACGYRANRKDSTWKRYQSKVANAVRSKFVGDGVRDTGCSLKAMKRDCRRALVPFYGMHRFIPALIGSRGYKVLETPVNHRPRAHGESKYGGGFNRVWKASVDMFGVRWLNRRALDIRINPPAESTES